MNHLNRCAAWVLVVLFSAPAWAQGPGTPGAAPEPIAVWPGVAPGDKGDLGEEKDTTRPDPNLPPDSPDYIIRLGNVSKPTITVYKPPADKDTGAAVVVCPGGAYQILAMNLEGTEVCRWLNSLGVTGVLLKYRVPARQGVERHAAALQDVQRAIGMVRHRAGEWKIDPNRIGVLGFSAGGHLAAAASNNFTERAYPAFDEADKVSCRPDFAVLVYPAYLVTKDDKAKVAPELKVTDRTPPTIVAMTQDDPIGVEGAYAYALAMKNAKVPCEVHVYPVGGHGYGLRPSDNPVSTAWPVHVAEWMGAQRLLKGAGGSGATHSAAGPDPDSRANAQPAGGGSLRWYKGNLHTHSLWSDGDQFPEPISAWYRDHGYHFLAISDHNTLQVGERWVRYRDLQTRGTTVGLDKYLRDFASVARVRGDRAAGTQEVRLTPLAEYRPLLDKPGEFLLIPSEEISDKLGKLPVHMNATNLAEVIKPQGGTTVAEIISNNLRAVQEQGRRLNRPVLAHLNHPNFGWGVTATDLAEAREERFFEVYNGHPGVNQTGDKEHDSVERIWDVANTFRMTARGGGAPPLMGLATDDSHHYHVGGMNRSTSGRGWVWVRAGELSAAALIAAMHAGDFYASSGILLADVKFDPASKTLRLDIEPAGDAVFTTQFVGTLAPAAGVSPPPDDVGIVFAKVEGLAPSYKLTGRELYVRAVVTSDRAPVNPSFEGQKAQAWTQPVGWEGRLKR